MIWNKTVSNPAYRMQLDETRSEPCGGRAFLRNGHRTWPPHYPGYKYD